MEPASAFRNSVTRRNEFFTKLKPICVQISRLGMRQDAISSSDKQQLTQLTDQLYNTLNSQTSYDASVLDSKLAEYVFFPLSYIFRKKEELPARLVENAVKVVRVLIQHGWKSSISKELSQQLLILLTFIVGGVPGEERKQDAPEETVLEGFKALSVLVRAAGSVSSMSSHLTEATVIPTLGHSITVMLDGVQHGDIPEIQLEALNAVQSLYTSIRDLEALASFLPGTVSGLAGLLSPPKSLKTQRRVLVRGLQVLKTVLVNVMGDMATRDIQKMSEKGIEEAKSNKSLTPAWLKVTAAQVKIALSTILKLRKHDLFEVRSAVAAFSVTILDECHSSLSNCTSILVETAIIAGGEGETPTAPTWKGLGTGGNSEDFTRLTSLEDLATIYPGLGDVIKTTVYDWISSLPRTMQLSDETIKKQAIQNLLKGNKIVRDLGLESAMLEDTLAMTLRDSIVTLVLSSKQPKIVGDIDFDDALSSSGALVRPELREPAYLPVILAQDVQLGIRKEFLGFLSSIGSPVQQAKLAYEMLSYVQDTQGVEQIASYWLAFHLMKSSFSKTSEVDPFLDLATLPPSSDDQELVFNELYAFSVSTLAEHSDSLDVDWRLEAIALEVTAFASTRLGESFRPELIDVLYPISTFLGSPTPQLRHHAIETLNCISVSCDYSSVSEMIIDNVDYMVNSISLRLNTLDISPASTKVLTMMIRLTGPKVIPYLDDVIAAIFAALDNYHGYPLFVSSLFAVLAEVVEQGAKSDTLLIEGKEKLVSHKKRPLSTTTTENLLSMLDERAEKRKKQLEEIDVEEVIRGHPQQPWRSEAENLLNQKENPEEEQEDESGKAVEKVEVPKTPTYQILSRIVTLTQHYLTSPTPTLRKSLLDLLKTVAPALAPDENAFLPLVNAVWPVIVSRLYDSEAYIAISACGTLTALAEGAGDFLASRIKTEWWDRLGKWCAKAKRDAALAGKPRGTASGRSVAPGMRIQSASATGISGLSAGSSGGILIPVQSASGDVSGQLVGATTPASLSSPQGLGRFAQTAQVWDAVVELLVAIVSYVRVDDDIFDEILGLLSETLMRNAAAREALEAVNADAVWLAMYRRGEVRVPARMPQVDGVEFVKVPARALVR